MFTVSLVPFMSISAVGADDTAPAPDTLKYNEGFINTDTNTEVILPTEHVLSLSDVIAMISLCYVIFHY